MASPVAKPTHPWWLKDFSEQHICNKRPLPQEVDICIIGGGISGVSVALHLRRANPSLQVVLLESRHGLSHGATGRNGGLLWPSLNASWTDTVKRLGMAEARAIMQYEHHCVDDLVGFIKEEGLQERVRYAPFNDGAFSLYVTPAEAASELSDLSAMQAEGFHTGNTLLSHAQVAERLGTRAYCCAVHQPGVHRVWAARLVHALADMAASIEPRQNLAICIETHVDGIKPAKQAASGSMSTPLGAHGKGPQWEVYTNQGILRTGAVVHCTNGYASGLLPQLLTHALVPVRNQVAATVAPYTPLSKRVDAAFYARGGYVYFSTREDGRVVIGGFRDVLPGMEWGVHDDASLRAEVSGALRAYLPSMFGLPAGCEANAMTGYEDLYETEWSGILGFTQDRFPLVGPVPGLPGQFISAGFSGHGMTRCFTCARAVAAMAMGAEMPQEFPRSFLPTPARLCQFAKPHSQAAASTVLQQGAAKL